MSLLFSFSKQIYGYLADKDRFSMSQVVSKWNEIFGSASLWRERAYKFAGVYTNVRLADKALGFAKQHAGHLKVRSYSLWINFVSGICFQKVCFFTS